MTDKRKTILIADDESYIRDLYGQVLESLFPGYQSEIFEDGSSLEKRLNQDVSNLALVITDNKMPGITGSEIIEKYAKRDEFAEVPFILIYAGNPEIGEGALRNGAYAFKLKPLKSILKDICEVAREALNYPKEKGEK